MRYPQGGGLTDAERADDGVLAELPVPGHRRLHGPAPTTDEFPPDPGLLLRTEETVPTGFSTDRQDKRPAW